jgi:hypothetical protein
VAAIVVVDVERDQGFAGLYGLLLQKLIDKSLPRRRVHSRRLGQHAVEIDEDRVVVSGRQCDDRRGVRHGVLQKGDGSADSAALIWGVFMSAQQHSLPRSKRQVTMQSNVFPARQARKLPLAAACLGEASSPWLRERS